MIATQMQLAQIQLEVMTVFATLDLLEMDSTAQVYAHWRLHYSDGIDCVTSTYMQFFF